jgi:hypothetical protein
MAACEEFSDAVAFAPEMPYRTHHRPAVTPMLPATGYLIQNWAVTMPADRSERPSVENLLIHVSFNPEGTCDHRALVTGKTFAWSPQTSLAPNRFEGLLRGQPGNDPVAGRN